MHIEIYSKDGCTQCVEAERIAQQICQENANTYNKLMLNSNFSREELFKIFPQARTFPQIKIDDQVIGGLTDFVDYLQNL